MALPPRNKESNRDLRPPLFDHSDYDFDDRCAQTCVRVTFVAFLISRAVALLSVDHREKPTSGKIRPRRRFFSANIISELVHFVPFEAA